MACWGTTSKVQSSASLLGKAPRQVPILTAPSETIIILRCQGWQGCDPQEVSGPHSTYQYFSRGDCGNECVWCEFVRVACFF